MKKQKEELEKQKKNAEKSKLSDLLRTTGPKQRVSDVKEENPTQILTPSEVMVSKSW